MSCEAFHDSLDRQGSCPRKEVSPEPRLAYFEQLDCGEIQATTVRYVKPAVNLQQSVAPATRLGGGTMSLLNWRQDAIAVCARHPDYPA
jgi:hypothetical protein